MKFRMKNDEMLNESQMKTCDKAQIKVYVKRLS